MGNNKPTIPGRIAEILTALFVLVNMKKLFLSLLSILLAIISILLAVQLFSPEADLSERFGVLVLLAIFLLLTYQSLKNLAAGKKHNAEND